MIIQYGFFQPSEGGPDAGWGTVALVQNHLGRRAWMLESLFNRA